MKKVLLIILTLGVFASCATVKKAVNDGKIAAVEKVEVGTALFLDKEFKKMGTDYSSLNCAVEAKKIGANAGELAADTLKPKPANGFLGLSAGGEIARVACGMIADKFIPELIAKEAGEYVCFSKRFGDYSADYIKKELCNSIEF